MAAGSLVLLLRYIQLPFGKNPKKLFCNGNLTRGFSENSLRELRKKIMDLSLTEDSGSQMAVAPLQLHFTINKTGILSRKTRRKCYEHQQRLWLYQRI